MFNPSAEALDLHSLYPAAPHLREADVCGENHSSEGKVLREIACQAGPAKAVKIAIQALHVMATLGRVHRTAARCAAIVNAAGSATPVSTATQLFCARQQATTSRARQHSGSLVTFLRSWTKLGYPFSISIFS